MTERIRQFPVWVALAVLVSTGMMRGTSFYLLSRRTRAQAEQGPMQLLRRPGVRRAEAAVGRVVLVGGLALVTAAFVIGRAAAGVGEPASP